MSDTIINRVAESTLMTFDLEKFYQIGTRKALDLSQWLDQGVILREKDFRTKLKEHDWSVYQDQFIAIDCVTDAVLPAWASLLVTTYLQPFARKVVKGTLADLEIQLFSEEIQNIPVSSFENALQGRMAGVNVAESTGEPGASPQITIRGTGSIHGNAS